MIIKDDPAASYCDSWNQDDGNPTHHLPNYEPARILLLSLVECFAFLPQSFFSAGNCNVSFIGSVIPHPPGDPPGTESQESGNKSCSEGSKTQGSYSYFSGCSEVNGYAKQQGKYQ
jgi:hypothetical protein